MYRESYFAFPKDADEPPPDGAPDDIMEFERPIGRRKKVLFITKFDHQDWYNVLFIFQPVWRVSGNETVSFKLVGEIGEIFELEHQ